MSKQETLKLDSKYNPQDYYGCLYVVTDTKNKQFYLGTKAFHKNVTNHATDTIKKVETNWRFFKTHNKQIKAQDYNDLSFQIIYLAKDKEALDYLLVWRLIQDEALEKDVFINTTINSVKNVGSLVDRYIFVPKDER